VTAASTPAPLPARFARLVKIEHTVFALPFAYVGAFLAVGGRPSWHDLLWITLAMVGARSLAMALNRLIDAGIDARNPRTAGREIPSGQLSVAQVSVFCVASLALFTWLCHFWLGAVDGLAPVGAWVAITGKLPWQSWMLGAAVAFWVAGFDCFYALFDQEIDRREGLHSIVTRFGVRGAFFGARLSHAATVACLAAAGLGLSVGVLYWLGVVAVAVLLAYEHSLVRPGDLRRLDAAFFTMNGVISVVFAVFVIVDAVT
jgi:4-hydroxybenzoate polyprenyltransferase